MTRQTTCRGQLLTRVPLTSCRGLLCLLILQAGPLPHEPCVLKGGGLGVGLLQPAHQYCSVKTSEEGLQTSCHDNQANLSTTVQSLHTAAEDHSTGVHCDFKHQQQ